MLYKLVVVWLDITGPPNEMNDSQLNLFKNNELGFERTWNFSINLSSNIFFKSFKKFILGYLSL